MITLAQLHAWLPGSRLVGSGDIEALRVHTDTRTLAPGDLFVALRGERFDAHEFLAQARAAGAVGALAERGLAQAGLPGVEVTDSRQALGDLAAAWRAQFSLPLVAVTGSNGKTTVTQMVASILRAAHGDAALATQGNLNNEVGLPLTLLRLRPAHRAAVVELGMNHPGEIARLAQIARPTVALVNNAQREHQEFMTSVEAVARENGSVIAALPPEGCAVLPAADAHLPMWRAMAGCRPVLTFGLGDADSADVQGAGQWRGGAWDATAQTPLGPLSFRLAVAGRHNLLNAMAACACAVAAGVPAAVIVQGLSRFEPVAGRSRTLSLRVGARALTLVDDTYNANPDSVRAAIDVLAGLPGPRLLVLGDMGEVGDQGPAFHAEVGAHARDMGIEQVFTTGDLARHIGGLHFDGVEALNAAVAGALPRVASVLVKGSRFMRMERVVAAIAARADKETTNAA